MHLFHPKRTQQKRDVHCASCMDVVHVSETLPLSTKPSSCNPHIITPCCGAAFHKRCINETKHTITSCLACGEEIHPVWSAHLAGFLDFHTFAEGTYTVLPGQSPQECCEDCPICQEPLPHVADTRDYFGQGDLMDRITTPCRHTTHRSCLLRWMDSLPDTVYFHCPMCRGHLLPSWESAVVGFEDESTMEKFGSCSDKRCGALASK